VLTILDLKAELAKLQDAARTHSGDTRRPIGRVPLRAWRPTATAPSTSPNSPAKAMGTPPNGDEIVQVVDGATTLHIMAEDGPQSFVLKAGMW